jgi:class 3 adenylate cyclase
MFKQVAAYVESFIPEGHRGDPELLRKGRIFVWLYASGIPLVLLLNLVELITGSLVNPLLGFGFIGFFVLMLNALKRGFSAERLNNAIILVAYAAFVFGALDLGGLRAANLPFIILFPQVAMLLNSRASGIFWLIVSALVVIGIYALSRSGAAHLIGDDALSNDTMVVGFMLNAMVFIFAMLYISESSRISTLRMLQAEKKRSDDLLLNILPADVAEELKREGRSMARHYDEVTVLFTDFKGFTDISEKLTPQQLVEEINSCFEAFDAIMDRCGIEKIKTIGDAYMAVGGLPKPTPDAAARTVQAALEMQAFIREREKLNAAKGLPAFEMRIGIHTGPVVAGIVGVKKFQYDIWGDTVNTASRMESSGEVGKVNISEATYALVKDEFECEYRGEIEAKGKGKLGMWFAQIQNT